MIQDKTTSEQIASDTSWMEENGTGPTCAAFGALMTCFSVGTADSHPIVSLVTGSLAGLSFFTAAAYELLSKKRKTVSVLHEAAQTLTEKPKHTVTDHAAWDFQP